MNICGKEKCEVCPIDYTEGDYLRDLLQGINNRIHWNTVYFVIIFYPLSYLILGKIGLVLAFIFNYIGIKTCGFLGYNPPKEEYPPNVCSAGVEDCKICLNTYIHDHDFNVKYYQSLKWWEK